MNKICKTFPIVREIKQLRKERKLFLEEAIRKFNDEKPIHGSLSDYKKALIRHRVSYREYMYGYEFWKLNENERNEFISQREMWCIYRKVIHKKVRKYLIDKVLFLKTFEDFVHRDWIYPLDSTFEAFHDFVSSHDCIAKPLLGDQGKGIFIINKAEGASNDVGSLYDYCKDKNYLVEERIKECKELEEFHPSSLNTIRVVTMSGNGNCVILGALLRMGVNGNFVDNTKAGGIIAVIDVNTGEIITDGIDLEGNQYKYHPNTQKDIKGFVIPQWDRCVEMCKKASQVIPENYFTGWDVCILSNGKIELIEGNSAPDVDGGIQIPLKKGFKRKIQNYGKEMMGFDPLSLISVWSRSYKKWD